MNMWTGLNMRHFYFHTWFIVDGVAGVLLVPRVEARNTILYRSPLLLSCTFLISNAVTTGEPAIQTVGGNLDDSTAMDDQDISPPPQGRRNRREACTCPFCKDGDGRYVSKPMCSFRRPCNSNFDPSFLHQPVTQLKRSSTYVISLAVERSTARHPT